MFSTVTNQDLVRFMLRTGCMNTDRYIEFMSKLIENKELKLFLILDNLRVQHCKTVNQ